MTRIDTINEFMLKTMEEEEIEDTIENRIAFLTGLGDAWREDTDTSIEKTLYQVALMSEITSLNIKLKFGL